MLSDRARSGTLGLSLVLVAVLLPLQFLGLPPTLLFTLVIAMAWATAAVGLDLLVGYSGQLSFGQAGFVGLGAYLVTVGRGEPLSLGFGLTIVLAILVVTVLSAIFGLAVSKYSAFGFAVSTFFFAHLVQAAANGRVLSEWTGGPSGLLVPDLSLGAVSLVSGQGLYTFAWAILFATVFLVGNLVNSRTGHELRMVKYNETVAGVAGLKVNRLKIMAFVFCCLTGVAAGLTYSLGVGYLSPDSFGQTASIYLFAMVVVGGMGTLAGPIIGALLFTVVPQQYLDNGPQAMLAFAALTLLFMVLLPRGLIGVLLDLVERRRGSRASVAPKIDREQQTPQRNSARAVGKPLIVENLTVKFGGFVAVRDTELTVRSESFHAVVGPNGAGKTTLLNALSGIAPLASGRVVLGDVDITHMKTSDRREAGIARTFQTPALVPDLTALENVALGVQTSGRFHRLRDFLGDWAHRTSYDKLWQQAHAALDEIDFSRERRTVQGVDLTMSEQKLVELARAIASGAAVILLDEPTAGLSGSEIDVIGDALAALKPRGTTVVVIAHHIDFVKQVADSVTVMENGAVLMSGKPSVVFDDPRVREAFMGIEAEEKLEHMVTEGDA